MDNEKRKRLRVGVNFPVVILQNEARIISMTRDISLKGLLAEPRPEIRAGEPCFLSILLSSGISIDIDAIATMNSSRGAAFDFVKMDEQSFHHLHNLVRLHSPDPDKVDQELTKPAFDRELLARFSWTTQKKKSEHGA